MSLKIASERYPKITVTCIYCLKRTKKMIETIKINKYLIMNFRGS